MDCPVVVIADCRASTSNSSDNCQRLIRDLLNDQEPRPNKIAYSADVFDVYPLRLETKYYWSDVGLCHVPLPTIGDEKFAAAVEAVILFVPEIVDLETDTSFGAVLNPWMNFIQHWEETAVKLVACNRVPSKSSSRLSIQQWCIQNDFELIELDPDAETVREADDCGEVTGAKRILQALTAHSWSNLVMKDERELDADRAQRLRDYLDGDGNPNHAESLDDLPMKLRQCTVTESSVKADIASGVSNVASASGSSKLHSDIDQILGVDDPFASHEARDKEDDSESGDGSFEELFGQFAQMKETASSLPPDQRKAYAEKVTLAFWRAIGGDENEIAGIGDSSDEDIDDKVKINK